VEKRRENDALIQFMCLLSVLVATMYAPPDTRVAELVSAVVTYWHNWTDNNGISHGRAASSVSVATSQPRYDLSVRRSR
jgi:hypothetical protein